MNPPAAVTLLPVRNGMLRADGPSCSRCRFNTGHIAVANDIPGAKTIVEGWLADAHVGYDRHLLDRHLSPPDAVVTTRSTIRRVGALTFIVGFGVGAIVLASATDMLGGMLAVLLGGTIAFLTGVLAGQE